MKILFAVWEMDPLFKVGGLGDVARSLPGALSQKSIDVRTVIPYYAAIKLKSPKKARLGTIKVPFNGKTETVTIYATKNPKNGTIAYLLAHKKLLSVPKLAETYAFFDKAVVWFALQNPHDWKPDIIHCNDHHTGLIPLIVKEFSLPFKTMLTIHNMAHQGTTSVEAIEELGLPKEHCRVLSWEIESRKINFLMEGIIHADVVTTVSPSYAKEIMTEAYGAGLEEILRGREGRVFGILNGIDLEWKGKTLMQNIRTPYARISEQPTKQLPVWDEGKRKNKLSLQRSLRLKADAKIPLVAFIGRMDPWQKGIDLIHKMLRRFDSMPFQFVLLGTGNTEWEERFTWLDKFFPKSISCTFKYDEHLAYQIYAGADVLLIPSRFEPCGLIQMLAMYFGTLPIARNTGGLSDSISDGVNGFLFQDYSSEALEGALTRALTLKQDDPFRYKQMVEAAMYKDFSWSKSADAYIALYEKILSGML